MSSDKLEQLAGSSNQDSKHHDDSGLVIVGGGTMGQGIALSASKRGLDVLLIEHDDSSLERSFNEISEFMDREIARWAMTESEKKAILAHIKPVVGYEQISDQQYIIETVSENLELKKSIFTDLEKHCAENTIFITNTSTFSITELASYSNRPDRFIGMHFLNPVSKVKLVELVRGLNTSLQTFNKALVLAQKLEREAIEVFESPGYVTTRVMMPLVNEAIQVLMEGIASAEDIDKAIRMGYEIPHGPLEMADRIGLDQILNWLDILFHNLGDPKYRPCPMLRMLVRAGHLGLKTGRGFFRYDADDRMIPGSGQRAAAYERFLDAESE
ncbi:MAG: 3-hydroxyacyl-CoA dehydrogenase NAD-binding domain-containing protein [Calditrichota bacterium]